MYTTKNPLMTISCDKQTQSKDWCRVQDDRHFTIDRLHSSLLVLEFLKFNKNTTRLNRTDRTLRLQYILIYHITEIVITHKQKWCDYLLVFEDWILVCSDRIYGKPCVFYCRVGTVLKDCLVDWWSCLLLVYNLHEG